MRTLEVADLNVRLAGGTDREGGGSGPLVVLMHGYGAPGEDLLPLFRVLPVPREVRFAFPEAPLAPPDFAAFGGRAWWQIDVAALQLAAAAGRARDRTNETPPGMVVAREQMNAVLDGLEHKLGVSGDRIVLGGFSQGAMLATDIALHRKQPLAGLALLSSTLLCRDVWAPLMAARAALPVLQTHGREDPLLSFEIAVELRDLWRAAGAKVEWVEFRGGHEIPSVALEALGRFLQARLGASADVP